MRRARIIAKYFSSPIEFKSLTFRGRSRLTDPVLTYNKRFNSKIKAYARLSWGIRGRKVMRIPVKYSKSFHGNMKEYNNFRNTSYTLVLDENKKQVTLVFGREAEVEYPDANGEVAGIDVNSKRNLFCCSTGDTADFDRELLELLEREELKTDFLKSKKPNYEVGRRRQSHIDHMKRELESKIREKVAVLCERLKSAGVGHIVLEDLTGFNKRTRVKDEHDLNYNRRVRLLKLSSMKNEILHVARHHGLAVSLVQSAYTSQRCPICGCVDEGNRLTQQNFVCVECGHVADADVNAAINIRERVVSTVLRDALLKKTSKGRGTYEPKFQNREKVLEALLSLRYNSGKTYQNENHMR